MWIAALSFKFEWKTKKMMIYNYYYPLCYLECIKNDFKNEIKINGGSIYFSEENVLKYFDNQTLDLNSYNV